MVVCNQDPSLFHRPLSLSIRMILGPGDRPTAPVVSLVSYSCWAPSSANVFCGLSPNATLKNAVFGRCSVARLKASAKFRRFDLGVDWPASASLLAFHLATSCCFPAFLYRYFLLTLVTAKARPMAMGTKTAEARFALPSQPSSYSPLKT
jgi:hypothetical protein